MRRSHPTTQSLQRWPFYLGASFVAIAALGSVPLSGGITTGAHAMAVILGISVAAALMALPPIIRFFFLLRESHPILAHWERYLSDLGDEMNALQAGLARLDKDFDFLARSAPPKQDSPASPNSLPPEWCDQVEISLAELKLDLDSLHARIGYLIGADDRDAPPPENKLPPGMLEKALQKPPSGNASPALKRVLGTSSGTTLAASEPNQPVKE